MDTPGDGLPLIVSCEHGGNTIPDTWRYYFESATEVLPTHRGYDIGALAIARHIAQALQAPLHAATVSRLLIDLNRSPNHPRLYSEWTRPLTVEQRQSIARDYYQPYRQAVEAAIGTAIARGHNVLHVSVHSFTPLLDGTVREAEVGLLYDPKRKREKNLSLQLQNYMQLHLPQTGGDAVRIRRNYPYSGVQDGFIPWLRKRYLSTEYVGLELEFNQALLLHKRQQAQECTDLITAFLRQWLHHNG